MDTKIGKNLREKVENLKKDVYIVFPEAHSGNVYDAIIKLEKFPRIKPIPLSKRILDTGEFNELIDLFCDEFREITLEYLKKQAKKGRISQEEVNKFNKDKAKELLHDPLNLALMMVRKGYADAEVGGVETTTAEHTRRSLYIVNKSPNQDNIVCSITIEFANPRKVEEKEGEILREQKFLTIVDPALGKPAMEYTFLSGVNILKSLYESGQINEEVYKKELKKVLEEKRKYIQLKVDQALSALKWHYLLTGEFAVGAFITHSTAGSDEYSPYIRFVRNEVIPAIVEALEKEKKDDELLQHATFISQECQVEAAADPRIAKKKVKSKDVYVGFANVHVCDSVVSANQHYKTFLAFGNITSTICWSGFKRPIYDLSRSSPVNDIVLSALIAALQSKDEENPEKKEYWYKKAKEIFNKTHSYNILVINPGSTSTKVAFFHNKEKIFNEEIKHLEGKNKVPPLEDFENNVKIRLELILNLLKEKKIDINSINCVMGRGGLLDNLKEGGVYEIDELMLEHLETGKNGIHASNLGAPLAKRLADKIGAVAYIADPVVIDERSINAKITGIKGVLKKPRWHALNQKYVARQWAEQNNKNYYRCNIIVAHLGGGLTVGAHKHGKVVDVNNGLDGDGVFSINRSGSITPVQTIELLEKYGKDKVYKLITREGGFASLLGTQDFKVIMRLVKQNDPQTVTYYNAFVYQLAKQICSLLPAFYPEKVDQIIFTGGLARSSHFIQDLVRHLPSFLAKNYTVYPGEYEMEALAYNGLRVLRGIETPKKYGECRKIE